MSIRLAFFNLGGLDSKKLEQLHNKMSREKFSEEKESGFLLEKSFPNEITGRFVRSSKRLEEIVTPLGQTLSYERKIYHTQQFTIRKSSPQLLIENPSFAFKIFAARLAEYSGFSISLKTIECSVDKLLSLLNAKVENLQVVGLRTEGIPVTPRVSAYMKFEGKGHLQKIAKQFLGARRKLVITSAKIEFSYRGHEYQCGITDSGRMLVYGERDDDLISLLADAVGSLEVT